MSENNNGFDENGGKGDAGMSTAGIVILVLFLGILFYKYGWGLVFPDDPPKNPVTIEVQGGKI